MNQLFDFLPIALFVAVFFLSDIFYATAALMVGVTAQVVVYKLLGKKISKELKITFWASILFGSLTLIFRNETFIQWKPTIVNWLFCLSLIGSHFVGQKNLLQRLLGHQLSLTEAIWVKLNFGWAFGFFFAGALNLWVAFNFSMEFRVSYKLIGGFGLTLLYIVITLAYLASKGFMNDKAMAPSATAPDIGPATSGNPAEKPVEPN
jgi:intracellular septation protein